jgi:hypothetical protein
MMSAWMTRPENINTPYPSIAERHTFVAVGGITDRQVLDWFSNNRKRHWKVRVCVRGVARVQCAGCYSSCAHGIANQPLPTTTAWPTAAAIHGVGPPGPASRTAQESGAARRGRRRPLNSRPLTRAVKHSMKHACLGLLRMCNVPTHPRLEYRAANAFKQNFP